MLAQSSKLTSQRERGKEEVFRLQGTVKARRRAALTAEIEIIQSCGKHGIEQKIHDFLLRFSGRKPKGGAQRLNRRAPSTLADVSASKIKVSLSKFGIVARCVLQVRYRLVESALVEQRPPVIEASVGRTEAAKTGASARPGQRENDKQHEKLVFHESLTTMG